MYISQLRKLKCRKHVSLRQGAALGGGEQLGLVLHDSDCTSPKPTGMSWTLSSGPCQPENGQATGACPGGSVPGVKKTVRGRVLKQSARAISECTGASAGGGGGSFRHPETGSCHSRRRCSPSSQHPSHPPPRLHTNAHTTPGTHIQSSMHTYVHVHAAIAHAHSCDTCRTGCHPVTFGG